MNKLLFIAVAAAALAACDNSNSTDAAGENAVEVNAPAIVLPPAITASKTYRCSGDNSLIYIDWYSDGSARVKASQTDVGTEVPAPQEGVDSPLTGSAESTSITYDGKTCNA